MIGKLLRGALVASLPIIAAGAAFAQVAEGDWAGTMKMASADVRVAAHIRKDASGKLGGTIESPDLQANLTLSGAVLSGDKLTLSSPDGDGHRLDLTWDAAAKGWTGTYTGSIGTFPVTLKPGAMPPAAVVAGMDGDWDSVLTVGPTTLHLVLHIKTTPAGGTISTLDSPDQNALGIPITLGRDGDAVHFVSPSIQASYDGKVSADDKTLTGALSQGGLQLPLVFSRK